MKFCDQMAFDLAEKQRDRQAPIVKPPAPIARPTASQYLAELETLLDEDVRQCARLELTVGYERYVKQLTLCRQALAALSAQNIQE